MVRPGRRNGPFQPNQETSQVGRAVPHGKGSAVASTHAKRRGGVYFRRRSRNRRFSGSGLGSVWRRLRGSSGSPANSTSGGRPIAGSASGRSLRLRESNLRDGPSAGDGTAVRIVRFLAREIESSGGRLTDHPMSSEVFPRRESGHLERSRKWSHGRAIL